MFLDNTLEVLSNENRRNILYDLSSSEADIFSYEEIAESLVEDEYLREAEKEHFKVQMAHNHLPYMDENGFVEHDSRSRTVKYVGDRDVEDLLDVIEEYEQI